MEDKFYLCELFETYGGLLTDKQREVFEMHYLMDLSLSEIGDEEGISRQNVSDTLKKAKEKLFELEDKLKVREKETRLNELAESTGGTVADKIKEIIGK